MKCFDWNIKSLPDIGKYQYVSLLTESGIIASQQVVILSIT